MFKQELRQAAESYGLPLTEEQLSRFERYYELLIEWNQKMNLTAITEPREVAVKHMIDSFSAWDDSLFSPDRRCTAYCMQRRTDTGRSGEDGSLYCI